MKNVVKRAMSLLLTLVMLLGMVSVDASAEDTSEEDTLEFTLSTDKKEAKTGEDLVVTVGIKNNTDSPVTVGSYQFVLNYDSRVLTSAATGTNPFKKNAYTKDGTTVGEEELDWSSTFNVPTPGTVKVVTSSSNAETYSIPANGEMSVLKLSFKVADDAETASTEISFDAKGENHIFSGDAMVELKNVDISNTAAVSINGNPPTLARVTVTDESGETVLESGTSKNLIVPLDGTTSYEYHAHAYSLMGTDITEQVTWTIGDGQTEYGGTSIGNDGTIIVSQKAAGIETTIIKAALNGVTVSADGFCVQRTPESEKTVTKLEINPRNAGVTVPTAVAVNMDFHATALNVYDDFLSDASITWKVFDSDGQEVPSAWGIRFDDSSQGKLTVNRNAKDHPGEYRVRAAVGGVAAEVPVTIALAESIPSGYTLNEGAVTTFAVPTANADGNERVQSYDLPGVTAIDQYGKEMPGVTVTWGNEYDELPDGVSVRDGKLYVSSSAAANSFTDGKLEFDVSLRCGNYSPSETLTLTREESQATGVTVSGGPTEALLVPGTGEAPVTGAPFTAVVRDQYGQAMTDAAFSWSVERNNSTLGSDGVSIGSDGSVSVSNAAAATVPDTNAVTFTATATSGSVSGSREFTVARAASVAKEITVTLQEDISEIEIPGLAPGQTKKQLTAVVKDQYGSQMQNAAVKWSIAPSVEGVSVSDDGMLTVTSDAAKIITTAQDITVTAVSGTITGTKTVSVKRGDSVFSGFNLYETIGDGAETPVSRKRNEHVLVVAATPMTVKYTAEPCDQYGNALPEEKIPTDLTYDIKLLRYVSQYNTWEEVSSYTKGDRTNPGVLEIGDAEPAGGEYLIQVTQSNTHVNAKLESYYFRISRKSISTVTVQQSGEEIGDTLALIYGDSVSVVATAGPVAGGAGSSWKWESSDTDILSVPDGTQMKLTAKKAGTAQVTVTYEDAEYYGRKTFTVTVGKRTIDVAPGTLRFSKVYDNTVTMGTQKGDPEISNILPQDRGTVRVSMSGGDWSMTDAGKYTVTLDLGLPSFATDNYQLSRSTIDVPYEITPAVLEIVSATAEDRVYDEHEMSVAVSSVTFKNISGTTVVPTSGYKASGTVADNNVGERDATITVELTGVTAKNYTLKENTCQTKVTIKRAAWTGETSGSMSAKYGNTATLDLATIGLPAGWKFGIISVTDADSILDGTPVLTGSNLNAKLKNDESLVGKTAVISIPVTESTNYNPYTITITVEVLDKISQSIEADDVTMIYGDEAKAVVKNAVYGDVTYAVASPDQGVISVDAATGAITAHKTGTAKVEIRTAGNSDYAAAVKIITVTVTRRTLTVTANDKSAYVGDQVPALDYRVDGLVSGDTLGELALAVSAAEPTKAAGQYDIVFTNADTVSYDKDKYELKTVNGTLTVTVRPVIDDQPRGSDIIVNPMPDGKLTVSTPKAVNGATVTITVTPDENKELKSLEVIDENGNRLPVTELGSGRFSFVMPAGKVTVNAVFGDANEFVNPYTDVKASDWYFDAVRYVTENGLMTGTGAGRFDPNLATSRAMIWTILARMSGVNTSGGSIWYAAAQQWSVTAGVSDGTDPNGVITREQLAAMLYRYAVSKGLVSAPAAADLSAFSDAASVSPYAAEAMQWAVSVGLINGMDGKLNPQGSATRAQVATMLMRFAELTK